MEPEPRNPLGSGSHERREGAVIISILKKLSDILEKVAEIVTGTLLVFLTVLIFVAVVFRFVLNNPIQWQYEATLVCLSWVTFVGMSMTFKRKEHMALTFVTGALPPKVRVVWMDAIDIVLMAFFVFAIYEGIAVTKSTWNLMYMTIPVRRGLFYLAFPIGSAFSVVHLVYDVLTRRAGDYTPGEAMEVR